MGLRGVKPQSIQKRFKAFFYGKAKVGKTMAAIQFPKPYVIDTERGAENDQYVEILKKREGVLFQTNDFEEVFKEVKALLTDKHAYQTLVIDPLTTLYNDLLDKAASKVGDEYGRHYNEANKRMKALYNLLLRLDMNVIITSHAKNEYGSNLSVIGQTFDCYRKMDYLFDLILQIQKRGKERVAFVAGTRLEGFEEGETFPFSYETIVKRYSKDKLERDAIPEILASDEDVKELERLIALLKLTSDETDKWLSKASATNFSEMSKDSIDKCIVFLQNKIKGDAA